MPGTNRYFTQDTFDFLGKLARHNDREWFEQHRAAYEDNVRSMALRFISDMADELAMLSPHFLAQAKKVGGSLMRIHRDVRFGHDKRPYKTNIGIQFRHEQGKDVHAPGFYLHIEPDECFVGVGVWHPDPQTLGKIRDAISAHPEKWQAALSGRSFKKYFAQAGATLTRPPRGYDKQHPYIDDIKRKDFIAIATLSDELVASSRFRKTVVARYQAADEYMYFLCQALELRY